MDEIQMYLLVPETIEELVMKTCLEKQTLLDMYNYDQRFGLVSKIYIVPAAGTGESELDKLQDDQPDRLG